MLIYVLRWRPSWISDRHKKQKLCRFMKDISSLIHSETLIVDSGDVLWPDQFKVVMFLQKTSQTSIVHRLIAMWQRLPRWSKYVILLTNRRMGANWLQKLECIVKTVPIHQQLTWYEPRQIVCAWNILKNTTWLAKLY